MHSNTFASKTFALLFANLFQSGLSLQTTPRSLPTTLLWRSNRVSVAPLQVSKVETAEAVSEESVPKPTFDWNEQWYPVFPVSFLEDSDDRDTPVAIPVLGRQLVVWKSEGSESRWSIFDDSCPHRRSPLSTGQVVKNGSTCSLKCRYHGWEFDAAGKCSKIPMNPAESTGQSVNYAYRAGSYPTKLAGGLLWVYLGNASKGGASQLPEIPLGSIPTEEETACAKWDFFFTPISYLSVVENALDPSHAPFTHEGSIGLTGSKYSPSDSLPMVRYDVVESKGENGGFTLVHTPYQISSAKAFGGNSTTAREFIPPCTLTAAPIPTFKAKIWLVPATPTETTVLAMYQETETKLMKLTRNFPKLRSLLSDWSHFSEFWNDNSYRFQSQDRITMQGQEQRKLIDRNWWDLKVTPSDTGVATFQRWIRESGGYGPFPLFGESAFLQPREPSIWEYHGKYCPRCRRMVRMILALENTMNQWSKRTFVASTLPCTFACVAAATNQNEALILPALSLSMTFLVVAVGFHGLSEWSKTVQRRVFETGDESWKQKVDIFGSSKQPLFER